MKKCWKTLKQAAMNVQRNAKTMWATTQTTVPGLIDFLGEKISKNTLKWEKFYHFYVLLKTKPKFTTFRTL